MGDIENPNMAPAVALEIQDDGNKEIQDENKDVYDDNDIDEECDSCLSITISILSIFLFIGAFFSFLFLN